MYPRRHQVNGKSCPGNVLEADWITIETTAAEAEPGALTPAVITASSAVPVVANRYYRAGAALQSRAARLAG